MGFCLLVCVCAFFWFCFVIFLNEETTDSMVRGKKHGKSALQSHNAFIAFSVRPHFPGYFMRGRKEAEGRKKPLIQRTPKEAELLAGGRAKNEMAHR